MTKLLYYMPLSHGGVADYACFQANALARLGVELEILTPADFQEVVKLECKSRASLVSLNKREATGAIARLRSYVRIQRTNHRLLAQTALRERFSHVLMGCFAEYLSPAWISNLKQLRRHGVQVGSIAHDPIRHFIVGPNFWHRFCIRCVYSQVDHVFVHEQIAVDKGGLNREIPVTVLPYGPNMFPDATRTRSQVRSAYQIPEDAKVFLAFGHVRDEKNIDLLVQAIAEIPNAFLVVVGDENSRSQKPVSYYQDLAKQLGVAERCRWDIRYVRGTEVGDLFLMADFCAFTYKASFQSASSALNTAAHYRKPVIASSGRGPMKTIVEAYSIGVWVEPDNLTALIDGIRNLIKGNNQADWHAYQLDNSWQRNATLLAKAMGLLGSVSEQSV